MVNLKGDKEITVYGQEMDNATYALARMNMILHGHETAELWRGNTLAAPYFKNPDDRLKTFDFAVANPPFSAKAWSSGLNPDYDEYGRFEYGIPPTKNGDYAFLLHLIASLNSKGKGAIILPHGVLFRGNKEADIRKNLIQPVASSRASSACRPICFTALASPPASWFSIKRTPAPVAVSL